MNPGLCARYSFSNHRASVLTVRNMRAGAGNTSFSRENVFHGGTWVGVSATAWITRNNQTVASDKKLRGQVFTDVRFLPIATRRDQAYKA